MGWSLIKLQPLFVYSQTIYRIVCFNTIAQNIALKIYTTYKHYDTICLRREYERRGIC